MVSTVEGSDRLEKRPDRNCVTFNKNQCKVLHQEWIRNGITLCNNTGPGHTHSRKQLYRKGSWGPSGQLVEQKSAACLCNKENQPHPGLY